MKDLFKHWQLIVCILSIAVGVGLSRAAIEQSKKEITNNSKRIDRIETDNSSTQRLLERIDERTKNIIERLDRSERADIRAENRADSRSR